MATHIKEAFNEMRLPVLQPRTTERVAYLNAINNGNAFIAGWDKVARYEILAICGELEVLLSNDYGT